MTHDGSHVSRLHRHCLFIDVFKSVPVKVLPALRPLQRLSCPFSVQTSPLSNIPSGADCAHSGPSVRLGAPVFVCAL